MKLSAYGGQESDCISPLRDIPPGRPPLPRYAASSGRRPSHPAWLEAASRARRRRGLRGGCVEGRGTSSAECREAAEMQSDEKPALGGLNNREGARRGATQFQRGGPSPFPSASG